MSGTLFVVATPLGNLEDLSARVARVLRDADLVYAEDTRVSRRLLTHLGCDRSLSSLHGHNEKDRTDDVLDALRRGKDVALLTDAGTPGVSDPGSHVVRAAHESGFAVSPIPGPSALAAALSVGGFPEASADAWFVGFLPSKGTPRRERFAETLAHRGVVVIYEAPHRAAKTLAELASEQPDRRATAGRELTKMHEEVRHGTLAELAQWAEQGVRGELTIVLGPSPVPEVMASDSDVEAALRRCLDAGLSTRDAATAVAAVMERPKRDVYQRCLALAEGPA